MTTTFAVLHPPAKLPSPKRSDEVRSGGDEEIGAEPLYRPLGHSKGYPFTEIASHPLIDLLGIRPMDTGLARLPIHRLVLFDAIGAGPHECFWCGHVVHWGAAGCDALIVDHVNWKRTDSRPSNLVPSCTRCNVTRRPTRSMRRILNERGWFS